MAANHTWNPFTDLNTSPNAPGLIRDVLLPTIQGRLEVQAYATTAALPAAGDFIGQFAYTTDHGVFWRWSGTAWRPINPTFASTTDRDAAVPSPSVGDRCTLTSGAEYVCLVAATWVLWSQPWTVYTPTVTGTSNVGSIEGRYRVSAGFYDVEFQFAATGAFTGAPVISLPVAAKAYWINSPLGVATMVDTSTGDRFAGHLLAPSDVPSTVTLAYTAQATGKIAAVSATAPFTWANTDRIYGRVQYGAL